MLTGVAVRLGGEALKGCEHTVAVWPWGWGGQGCWARDGGVARPRPMEHDAQPYECDQRELVEEKMRYHGKPPHTRAEMRVFYPVCQVAELAAGYRYTTRCCVFRRPLFDRGHVPLWRLWGCRLPWWPQAVVVSPLATRYTSTLSTPPGALVPVLEACAPQVSVGCTGDGVHVLPLPCAAGSSPGLQRP